MDTTSKDCNCNLSSSQQQDFPQQNCGGQPGFPPHPHFPPCCPWCHPFPPPPPPPWPPFPPCPPPPPPPGPDEGCSCDHCTTTEDPLEAPCLALDLEKFTVESLSSVTDFKPFKLKKILFRELPGILHFRMGSPSTEIGRYSQINSHLDFEPQKEVAVPAFAIGVFPVTQKQYEEVTGEKHQEECGCRSKFAMPCRAKDFVSWDDAKVFVEKVNSRLSGYELALPRDEEWEYACRAGSKSPWCDPSISAVVVDPSDPASLSNTRMATGLENYASYLSGSNNARAVMLDPTRFPPVGAHKPNAFGLYDMHGCVWEWIDQRWSIMKDGEDYRDPEMIEKDFKTVRGGGYWFNADDCRSANRHGYPPFYRNHGFGFRVVLRRKI